MVKATHYTLRTQDMEIEENSHKVQIAAAYVNTVVVLVLVKKEILVGVLS